MTLSHPRTALILALAFLCALLGPAPAAMAAERPLRDVYVLRAHRGALVSASVPPLVRAHSHNDYEQGQPLLDALSRGFTSVEADVWLDDGDLLVAHHKQDSRRGRTLSSLYLDPLLAQSQRAGAIYPGWQGQFQLVVDIKSDAESTYAQIHDELREHRAMLTTYRGTEITPGDVSVVISGERPLEEMGEQRVRFAGYEGRLDDLGGALPPSVMPLVSDEWGDHFSWDGEGAMPADERQKLRDVVDLAHAGGQQIRFWDTPDGSVEARRAVWAELTAAGVDFVNTDHLASLQSYLRMHQGCTSP